MNKYDITSPNGTITHSFKAEELGEVKKAWGDLKDYSIVVTDITKEDADEKQSILRQGAYPSLFDFYEALHAKEVLKDSTQYDKLLNQIDSVIKKYPIE